MKRIDRTIATVLAGPFALAILIGCGGANRSSAPGALTPGHGGNHSSAPEGTQSPKVGDLGKPQNAIQVTAIELGKELKADPAAAEKKYARKTLIVSGTVGLIFNDIAALETGEKGVLVQIFLKSKSTPATTKVESGYAVKIRGTAIVDHPGRLDLVDCTILDSKLAETPPIPAAKLTEEYAKNKDETDGKFYLKTIIVEGVIAKVVYEERYLLFAGHNENNANPLRVHASFKFKEDQHEALKKIGEGQAVKVRGQYRGCPFGDIVLGACEFPP
jgi:tRNA_anti-like